MRHPNFQAWICASLVALGIPIPIKGISTFKRVARIMLPVVSYFPMSLLFYGSGGAEYEPKYTNFFKSSDLLADDFLFIPSQEGGNGFAGFRHNPAP